MVGALTTGEEECTYCAGAPRLMPVADDEHHVRPVVRLHGDASGVSARDVEGRGATATGALDARAR